MLSLLPLLLLPLLLLLLLLLSRAGHCFALTTEQLQ